MTEQTNEQTNLTWLQQEQERLKASRPNIEELESVQFEENKTTTFNVDFSKEFAEWRDPADETVIKKIIPVTEETVRKNLWLNVKNPLYSEIIKAGVEGKTEFKVFQEGSKKNTRYILLNK